MVEDVFPTISLLKNNKITYQSMQQRSLLMFNSALKTKATELLYMKFVTKFKDHFIIKSFDDILTIDLKKMQEMLENYIMYQNEQGHSWSYVSGELSALKLFFAMNEVLGLNWIKLNKMKPDRKKLTGGRSYTTKYI